MPSALRMLMQYKQLDAKIAKLGHGVLAASHLSFTELCSIFNTLRWGFMYDCIVGVTGRSSLECVLFYFILVNCKSYNYKLHVTTNTYICIYVVQRLIEYSITHYIQFLIILIIHNPLCKVEAIFDKTNMLSTWPISDNTC